jgi:predicted amidohydrolase
MNLGLGVIKSVEFDIRNNMKNIQEAVRSAKENNIEFICFGETVLNGFDGLTWDIEEDLLKNAISQDSSVMNELRALAKENQIAIGLGYYEKYNNCIYDSYIILDECGEKIINYRRVSETWKEPKAYGGNYREGENFLSFTYKDKTFALTICGDLWFDNYLKEIKKIKCDYLLWPLYIDYSLNEWESTAKQEYIDKVIRAEKNTFIINSWNEIVSQANGGAFYIKLDGKIEKKFPMLEEGILKIEL